MDDLDTEIEAKRKLFADAQRQVETIGIELRALEQAAQLRPIPVLAPVPPGHVRVQAHTKPKFRGRQIGSLTKKWRSALADLARHGNPLRSMDATLEIAGKRAKVTPASARERMRLYVTTGVIEEQEGNYRVAQATIEKYRLRVGKEKAPVLATEASHLNGAEASG
jgi:hypothetical protein